MSRVIRISSVFASTLALCLSASSLTTALSTSQSVSVRNKSPYPTSEFFRSIEQHILTVDGLRVHYVESGNGRPVVLIHGNAGGAEDFELGTIDLLAREYRVVAIDRPGHGSSDRPRTKAGSLEFQAQLLHRTLSDLKIAQPVLVGHSWGAALALAYALKYPGDVSAMVLLAPPAYPDNRSYRLLRFATGIPVFGELNLVLGKSLLGRRMLRRELARAFYPQIIPDRYFQLVTASWLGRKQLKASFEDEWTLNDSLRKMSGLYQNIRIPVEIVTGDQDMIVSPNENAYRLKKAIPESQLIVLKNTGHEIPLTSPESIYTALTMLSTSSASIRTD